MTIIATIAIADADILIAPLAYDEDWPADYDEPAADVWLDDADFNDGDDDPLLDLDDPLDRLSLSLSDRLS